MIFFLFYLANQVKLLTVMHIISYSFFLPRKPSNGSNYNAYNFLWFFFYPSNPVELLTVMQLFPMVCFSFLPCKPSNVTNCKAYHFLRFVFLYTPPVFRIHIILIWIRIRIRGIFDSVNRIFPSKCYARL